MPKVLLLAPPPLGMITVFAEMLKCWKAGMRNLKNLVNITRVSQKNLVAIFLILEL